MSRIYVEFDKLSQFESELTHISSRIDAIKEEFKHTIIHLDWDIKIQSDIIQTSNQLGRRLDGYKQRLKEYSQFVELARNSYQALESDRFRSFFDSERDKYAADVLTILGPDGVAPRYSYPFFLIKQLEDFFFSGKPGLIPDLIPLVSPITPLLFLNSGFIPAGNTNTSSVSADWLGAEFADGHPGVTAWIGKAHGEAKGDWGSTDVNAYLGKGEAEAKAKAGFMQYKDTSKYSDGKWENSDKLTYLFAESGAEASVSAVSADAKAEIGTDMLGLESSAEGSLGTAKAEAKGSFSVGEEGVNLYAKGEAMVAAAEGKVSGSIDILGLEIKGTAGGYAGAVGVEGKAGIENNKFVVEGGVAAIMGGKIGLEVGFNEEGWSNFIDAVTFWD